MMNIASLTAIVSVAKKLPQSNQLDLIEATSLNISELIENETNKQILCEFSELCHECGAIDAEEKTYTHLLTLEITKIERLSILQSLLYLLQNERLTDIDGFELPEVSRRCIDLCSEALKLVPESGTYDKLNLLSCRVARCLYIARNGEKTLLPFTKQDIQTQLALISSGNGLPNHLKRENLTAFAQIDLAEAILLGDGKSVEAISLLESAIETLESARVGDWATNRGYALLETAMHG